MDSMEKAKAWLRDVEPRAQRLLSEPVAVDSQGVHEQLDKIKALQTEIMTNGRLIESAKQVKRIIIKIYTYIFYILIPF